jgi:hypothetical protein
MALTLRPSALVEGKEEMNAKLFRTHLQQRDLVVQSLPGYLPTIAPTEAVVVIAVSAKMPTRPMPAKMATR